MKKSDDVKDRLLQFTDKVIISLRIMNIVVATGFVAVSIFWTVNLAHLLDSLVRKYGIEMAPDIVTGLRLLLLLGIAVCVPVHIIFSRLHRMVGNTIAGNAFANGNAVHLRIMAWMLLLIQIADLALGSLSYWLSSIKAETMGWIPSISGWLSVLLLFILARIFDQGAKMQADLEGVV